MKFDVATFGSAFVDVYLQSRDFKLLKSAKVSGGVALATPYGGKLSVDNLTITSGGGATNTAVAFERLGLQTAAVCCVGDDDWGLFIRKKLVSEGVSPLYVQISRASQTSYATILVAPEGGRTILTFRGASNDLSWHKVAWGRLQARWFHVSSLGGDLAFLTKIVRTAQTKKIKVSFNPGGAELKAGKKLCPFLRHLEVLLLNQNEAEQLLKVSGEEKVEKKLKTLGVNAVVVTRGRKGSVVWSAKTGLLRQGIFPVDTVQETGAGDAFGSGFVGGLLLGHKLETAFKIAAANAAAVTTKIGPKEGLLFGPEINLWLKKTLRTARKP